MCLIWNCLDCLLFARNNLHRYILYIHEMNWNNRNWNETKNVFSRFELKAGSICYSTRKLDIMLCSVIHIMWICTREKWKKKNKSVNESADEWDQNKRIIQYCIQLTTWEYCWWISFQFRFHDRIHYDDRPNNQMVLYSANYNLKSLTFFFGSPIPFNYSNYPFGNANFLHFSRDRVKGDEQNEMLITTTVQNDE